MGLDLHLLTDAALALDPEDRLALATVLIDSVEEGTDDGWEATWAEEVTRRSASADAREPRGAAWNEVRARLLSELAGR